MANEHVVVQIDVDASGATAGFAQFNAEADRTQAKAQRVQESTMKMLVGVPQSADRVSLALKRLQASLDPVTKAQFQMEREMTKSMALIDRAVRTGVTTEIQAANTIAAIRQKQVRDLDAVKNAQLSASAAARGAANQNQGGLARFGSLNATSQFQDIAITSAMGQSPLTIALQQGTQLGMALEQQLGDQGVKGVVKGLGSAFMGLLTPINLLAIGLTGVLAVAIQFGSKLLPVVKTLKEATEDQTKSVLALGEAYGLAGLKAEDFARKSVIAAESAARRNTEELRKAADAANKEALGQLTTFVTPGRSAGGFFGPTSPQFAAFNDVIQKLNAGVKAGHPDFVAFEKGISDVVANNPGLQTTADKILGIVAAAAAAAAQLEKTDRIIKDINRSSVGGPGSVDRLREQGQGQAGLMRRMNPGAFPEPRNLVQEELDTQRRNESAWADMQRMMAKSPQEISAAVRRQEEAKVISGESNVDRADRIRIESTKALAQAEYQLIEAHKQRTRALEETLASSRLDLELIGKTTGEQAALRMEFEKTQELRRLAAENGIKVDQQELDLIHQKSVEYGKLADAIQKTNLLRDIQFERDQLFRLPGEQSIASRLRGTGMGLDSEAADAMRWNQNFAELKDGVRGFFDDFEEGLLNGDDIGEALGKAILNGLNKVLDNMLDQVLNQLANSITSAIMGSGAGGGGAAAFGTAGGFMQMLQTAGGFGRVPDNVGAGGVSGALGSYLGGSAGTTRTGIPLTELHVQGLTAKLSTQYADRFAGLFKDLDAAGYKIKSLGEGGYSFRQVAGTNNLSRHAFGEAVDINPRANPWSHNFKTDLPSNAGDIARANGLKWGGEWNKPDTMHFQVDKSIKSIEKLGDTTAMATKDIGSLGKVGADATQGIGQMTNALAQFPSAPGAFNGGAFGAGGGGLASLFGGGGGPDFSPWEMNYFTSHAGLWAKGGVFNRGNVIPFARGGVVDRPTLFPMANGAGLMGEAGPEGVLPLHRGANGSLGVAMHGGGSRVVVNNTVINEAGPSVSVTQETQPRPDGGVDLVTRVKQIIADDMSRPGTPTGKALDKRGARPALKRFG